MTELIFDFYHKHHSGRTMARVHTAGFYGISFNVFAEDDSDFNLEPGSRISTKINGYTKEIEVFASEEEYYKTEPFEAHISFKPYGTLAMFAKDDDGNQMPQGGDAYFCGVVMAAERDDSAGQNDANYCLTVETLEMVIHLHTRYEGEIEPGYIVRADADLCAAVK